MTTNNKHIINAVIKSCVFDNTIPESLINDETNIYLGKFHTKLSEFIKFLKDEIDFTSSKYFVERIKKFGKFDEIIPYDLQMNTLVLSDLTRLSVDRGSLINFIVTFMKTIDASGIVNDDEDGENDIITEESLRDAIEKHPRYDYNILIVNNISLLYIMSSIKNIEKFVEFISILYKISVVFYNEFIEKKHLTGLFIDIKVPCVIYSTNIDGTVLAASLVIDDYIHKDNIEKNKEMLLEKTDEMTSMVLSNFKSNNMTSLDDMDESSLGPLAKAVTDTKSELEKRIEAGLIDKNDLQDSAIYLLKMVKNKQFDTDPKIKQIFAMMTNSFMESFNTNKKNGGKVAKGTQELYDTLKNNFYDPNVKIPKEYSDMMKSQQKTVFKYK